MIESQFFIYTIIVYLYTYRLKHVHTNTRVRIPLSIQGVSRLVDITVRGDFLGLSDQKVHINMCPILDVYGVMGIF